MPRLPELRQHQRLQLTIPMSAIQISEPIRPHLNRRFYRHRHIIHHSKRTPKHKIGSIRKQEQTPTANQGPEPSAFVRETILRDATGRPETPAALA